VFAQEELEYKRNYEEKYEKQKLPVEKFLGVIVKIVVYDCS